MLGEPRETQVLGESGKEVSGHDVAAACTVEQETEIAVAEPELKKPRLNSDPGAQIHLPSGGPSTQDDSAYTPIELVSMKNLIPPVSSGDPSRVIDLDSMDDDAHAPGHTDLHSTNISIQAASVKTETQQTLDALFGGFKEQKTPKPAINLVPGYPPPLVNRLASPDNSKSTNEPTISLYPSAPVNDRSDQSSIVRAIAENSATIANLDRGLSSNGLGTTALSASPYGLSPSVPIPTLIQGSLLSPASIEHTLSAVAGNNPASAAAVGPAQIAGIGQMGLNAPAKKPDRLVLIYGKPRYYHSIMHLNELRNDSTENVRILELGGPEPSAPAAMFAKTSFNILTISIEYTAGFHAHLQKFIEFIKVHAAKIKAIPEVHYHFHLSPDLKWPSGYTQDERDSYTDFAKALADVAGDHVIQCSIVNKYDMGTVYITDPTELARIGQEMQQDISPWKNLQILDYVESSIRFIPKLKFPPTLKVLNIGGGYALETLNGFVMPPRLETLIASQGAILSIDNLPFPPTLKRLELSDNRIYFVAYADFPQLLEHLDLSQNRIESLRGVNFPRNLKSLDLGFNPLESFKGVRFPEGLEALDLTDLPNESMSGVKFPDLLKTLNLQASMTSTRGLKLPPNLVNLTLSANGVNSINPLKLPNSIEVLYLNDNNIKTLNKVNFPPRLRELYLGDNFITTLRNVMFPPTLQVLDFDMDPEGEENDKSVSSLKDVLLPPGLRVLKFKYHSFKTVESVEFPPSLETLSFSHNGLRSIRDLKFGGKLKTLDLTENPELTNIDHLDLPESVTELRIPYELGENLPAYIVERANRKQLVLVQSSEASDDF